MIVAPEDRNEMQRILDALNGKTSKIVENSQQPKNNYVELAGPGQPTSHDIDAMSQVLSRLNKVTSTVMENRYIDPQLNEALDTRRIGNSVKLQNYQIMIQEDQSRLAGTQYYSIYHSSTQDIIADNISLYEVALSVVKLLNNGKYVNSPEITRLFEHDDRYTSNRTDAVRFKRRMKLAQKERDFQKSDLYESRMQRSLDNAMTAKREIKNIIGKK